MCLFVFISRKYEKYFLKNENIHVICPRHTEMVLFMSKKMPRSWDRGMTSRLLVLSIFQYPSA